MQYATLAAYFDRLEQTTKRLEMTQILVELLDEVPRDEIKLVANLLQGRVAPDWEGIELGLAEKLVLQVLARSAGLNMAQGGVEAATQVYHDAGDLGQAAQRLLESKGGKRQTGLMAFAEEPDGSAGDLKVFGVFETLTAIAAATGSGSQEDKKRLLGKLLADASPLEAKYIIRTVAGRLRLGVADMTFLDALTAWYLQKGARSVTEMEPDERTEFETTRAAIEHGYDVRSDMSLVADVLAHDGLAAVQALEVEMGTPLRPMAAERLKTLSEILLKHDGRSALEYKYDGLRLQAHVPSEPDAPVRLFSRRMEELTSQFPDVCLFLREAYRGGEGGAIVEGECVAVDLETGRMRPFQDVSRRRGRKTGLGEDARHETAFSEVTAAKTMMDEVPVAVYLFDCLAAGGASIMPKTYQERRAQIGVQFDAQADRVHLSRMDIAEDEAAMEAFFAQAVADGAEGIMCKSLHGPYKAGNRGFDWIKYKTDYTEDLVDTMDLVVIGAFYGRGRRAGWYGALLMAAYDPDRDIYASVCKLGTGFDDETLQGLKERFAPHLSDARPANVESEMEPDVWFDPDTVMEVQAAELSLSPTHRAAWGVVRDGAGIAARFPRFSGRWRDDKSADQATTVGELVQMYELQSQ